MNDRATIHLHPRRRIVLAAAALAALAVVTFGPFVGGKFVFTDHDDVVAHPAMHAWAEGLRTIWLYPGSMPRFGPLADTLLLVQSRAFGPRPGAFHATSVLLHATNVLLLWLLLRWLELPGATVAAAAFAVLPAHAQTVAWVGQQRVLLCAAFYLAGLLWWVRRERRSARPILAMTAASLCHPMGLTFPLAAWMLRRSRAALVMLGAAVAAAALLLVIRVPVNCTLDWLYLPWAGLVTIIVCAITRATPPRALTIGTAIAGVVVIGLAVVAALRAPSFRSDHPYWQSVLRRNPASVEALVNLGQFDRALQIDPNHRGALLGLAAAHAAMNEWDRAIARYRQVLARDPRDADALSGLSVAYAHQNRTDDAIRTAREVLRLRPGDGRAHRELSVLYREQGDTRRAREHGERAIQLDPRRPEPYVELATLMLTRLGDVERAQSLLRQAMRIDPHRAETFRIAGQAQFDIAKLQADPARRSDGFNNAILLFRAAVKLAPNSAAAQRELGVALATSAAQPSRPLQARLDQLGEAVFRFDRAAALDPSLPDVAALRDMAERDRAALERHRR